MKILMSLFALIFSVSVFAQETATVAAPKKFKRVLVLAGGGINPAIGIGIAAGLEEKGWKPDLVIATCGFSMSAAMYNTFQTGPAAFEYSKSRTFFNVLSKIEIETPRLLYLNTKLKTLNYDELPNYFDHLVLHLPNRISGFLPDPRFNTDPNGTKTIILAAKAHFGPKDIHTRIDMKDRYTMTYMTDPDTALAIDKKAASIKAIFPESYFTDDVIVRSDVTVEQASRASVSDPILMNPGRIDEDYYFTGASNLFPLELAHQLGEEVVMTYPQELFSKTEEKVFGTAFGFSQTKRMLMTIQDKQTKWIDMTGVQKVKFDPAPYFLRLVNKVPDNMTDFVKGMTAQYEFGRARAAEAITVQATQANVRTHLRRPISPALINGITCENAFEWKLEGAGDNCTSEERIECRRERAKKYGRKCTVIR